MRLHRGGDPYPVLLGTNLIDDVGALVRRLWGVRRVAVVTQASVDRHHGARLRGSFTGAGVEAITLRMPAGEQRKSLETVSRLYDQLLYQRFSREDTIVAFGGGTVGDVAGFVAATLLRGIRYAQIPTTLLAQVDSSIGAKVGVNHPRGKNLIGSMYRPSAVWIDPSLLESLPERETRSGAFEMLKYGFIGAGAMLTRFETRAPQLGSDAFTRSIAQSVRLKLDIVRDDENENGLRRILNFGHTIGHALETASDYQLLRHGEAVGWGMVGAVRVAKRRNAISARLADRLEAIVGNVGVLPKLSSLSKRRVVNALSHDKKRSAAGLRFILPVGWGLVETVESFPKEEIAWAIATLGVGR